MNTVWVFADETGNFDFSRGQSATAFYGVGTATLYNDHPDLINDLVMLRRQPGLEGQQLGDYFHATQDRQAVRDRVFATILQHHVHFDVTMLEKAKAQPHIRTDDVRFYKHAWFLHMKYVAQQIASSQDNMVIVAAEIGTAKRRAAFRRLLRT